MKKHSLKKSVKLTLWSLLLLVAIVGISFLVMYFNRPISDEELVGQLTSLSYLNYLGEAPDPSLEGVTVNSGATPGYNYYYGGLYSLSGELVKNFGKVYLGSILPNGDLLGQNPLPNATVFRKTFDGDIVWEKDYLIHHAFGLNFDGFVYGLTKDLINYNGRKVEFDVILKINASDGSLVDRWSTWDNFAALHKYHGLMQLDKLANDSSFNLDKQGFSLFGGDYEYYHVNEVNFVPLNNRTGMHPAFKEGNLIISMRHGNLIFIIDHETFDIQWFYGPNQLDGPHSAQMTKDGNVVVLDNGRFRGFSRVIEINPVTLNASVLYKADEFYTRTRGHIEMLDSGNLLITETDKSRAFEVDSNGEIVWEYYHTELSPKGDFLEPLYRVYRYDLDFVDSFLK